MKTYSHLLEIASKFRGDIINEAIFLEKTIDTYLADYFCSDVDKAKEMHILLWGDNRITFENKKQIFDFIAKKHDAKWYSEYVSIRDDSRKRGRIPMASDLDFIIFERNVLVHCFLDTREGSREKEGVTFVRFKNDQQPFHYDNEKFMLISKVLINVINHFLKRLEYFSNSPSSPFRIDPK